MDESSASQCFAALGHQHRLQILQLLVESYPKRLSVSELGGQVGLKGATLTHHLGFLRNANLSVASYEGKYICHQANCERVQELIDYLDQRVCKRG